MVCLPQGRIWTIGGGARRASGRRRRDALVMRTKQSGRIQAKFAPETRFEVKLSPEGALRRERAVQLEDLKSRLLRRHVMYAPDLELIPAIRRAAHDAASVAWFTPWPLLVFPTLLDEKVESAKHAALVQERIWLQSRELFAQAA